MEIVNKIKEGVHLDNNIYDQPPDTMRDSLNGVISDEGGGSYKWRNIKGNTLSFTISQTDKYFAHCLIRERLFIITLTDNEATVKFWEITFVGNTGTANIRNTSSNTSFNFSFTYPIRAIWGFYENDEIQRIYLTDYNNQPRCINVGNSETIVIEENFTRFSPVVQHVYGKFTPLPYTTGGTIKAGIYFFAWRYYTQNGYYTDWSPLSNPIMVSDGTPGTTYFAYQELCGAAPNENTDRALQFRIEDIDTDFDNIQVCAFYSNDYNSSEPGVICYDGGINGNSTIDIIYRGNEMFGSVSIADLIETSIVIEKCKDMIYAKKKNVISCVQERQEIDVSTLTPDTKNNYLPADITTIQRRILLDVSGYPAELTAVGQDKGLFGSTTALYDETNHILRRGFWYKATTAVVWNDNGGANKNIGQGELFYVSETCVLPTWVSGTYTAVILKNKYRKGGVSATGDPTYDANNVYVTESIDIGNEYQDYKSQKINHYYRGYPHGEKIRLGVLFFDKTGRPFFIRYLKDNAVGDITISKRSSSNTIVECLAESSDSAGVQYNQVNGLVTGIKVSGLDITDIRNDIGGFMIVRCPIVHQYLGMGVLIPTYVITNDVYSYPRMTPLQSSKKNFPGCYDFICPEELFGLKDFVIKSGDEVENLFYFDSFKYADSYSINGRTYQYFGRKESTYHYNFYHKFYKASTHTHGTNGAPGAIHEIIAATSYKIGDDNVPVKPTDLTKLYQNLSTGYWIDPYNHAGTPGNHTILIFDIDEAGESYDLKGTDTNENTPRALLCALKRANADPYGGSSDSALANALYVSTGHFQEINSTVLNEIEDNGSYVFNDIDVFGGDTYICLFDYKRLYANDDLEPHKLGQSIIFPVESRVNIAMREGIHVAKDRTYQSVHVPNGIRMKVGYNVFEEFNYNDGYSTDNIADFYLPVPFDYKLTNQYDCRIRYSPEKNYGEKQDKFISFLANDFIDLDTNQGAITNIKYRQDKLIYWQPNEVGYIPIGERTLTQNSVGQPVQLGIGGIFERYDQLIDKIGNSNQLGLVESPMGFHWYDAKRKIFLNIDEGLKLSPESILYGVDSFFQTIPASFELSDTPGNNYGALGGYDPMTKMIFYTFFIDANTKRTIGINTIFNKFTGFYNFYPRMYIGYKGILLEGETADKRSFYVHGTNSNYQNFFGTQYEAYITLVIKEDSNTPKIYDTFELIGNSNIFTSAVYSNSEQSIEEVIAEYSGSNYTLQNRNYDFRKKRWLGNFPKVNRERLNDGYLQVKFKIDHPVLVELLELRSNVRKLY